jgi:20S proteasome alpha/beta subunit
VDESGEGALYWIDYLGTMARVTKGAHGYAGYFCSSVLDNCYKAVSDIKVTGIEHDNRRRYWMHQEMYYRVKNQILDKAKCIPC